MKFNRRLIIALAACVSCMLAFAADPAHMEIIEGKDVSGEVFKRLGLPNRDYCWEQCLKEERCVATRWGFIEGATAGQCQFLTGTLSFTDPKTISTSDGQKILVIASRKVISASGDI